jgi:hypothetical protein
MSIGVIMAVICLLMAGQCTFLDHHSAGHRALLEQQALAQEGEGMQVTIGYYGYYASYASSAGLVAFLQPLSADRFGLLPGDYGHTDNIGHYGHYELHVEPMVSRDRANILSRLAGDGCLAGYAPNSTEDPGDLPLSVFASRLAGDGCLAGYAPNSTEDPGDEQFVRGITNKKTQLVSGDRNKKEKPGETGHGGLLLVTRPNAFGP